MISINVRDTATELLDHIQARSESLPMDQIGHYMVESVRANFLMEGRPDPWEPRKEPTGSWPLLNKTGALFNSIHYTVQGRDEVVITHDRSYGDYVDQGTSKMVARSFLVVQDEDMEFIERLIVDHLMM